jgi:signal transduction histidine kinase/HPt (histidine-containing phosphotransfer) domain-containing protein
LNILLVEDNPGDARLLREMFKEQVSHTAHVAHVGSLGEAERYLAEHHVDIVILDLGLPDATGLWAVRRARAAAPRIPLVVLTGSDNELLAVQALQEGAQDYLVKGQIETRGLMRALRYAIERQAMEAKLANDVVRLKRAEQEREIYEKKIEASNETLALLAGHLEQARDEAERTSRAKTRFIAGMSHELRTPLNGIIGYAQLLHLDRGLTAAQSRQVESMLGAGRHLLQMIEDILDVSAVEAEHVELRTAEVDLNRLAKACLDLVRPMADGKGLTLRLATAPDVPRLVRVDPKRLRQVLLNLLGNAVKFTDVGAVELRIRVISAGAALRYEVADTGPGVPAEKRARLFQPFERLGNESARTTEGAGLGLSLSEQIATVLGGRIGYEDNPGGGSVFWLELPQEAIAEAVTVHADTAELPEEQPAEMSRVLRMLVVDDIAMNRDIAESFLRLAGHSVTCVERGAEAVAAVACTEFDVVLMDVRMPEMDGCEATRRIRALTGSRGRVPIVGLTAQAFTEQVAECRAAGMDAHLAKPFDQERLLVVVAQAAARRTTSGVGAPIAALPAAPLAATDSVMGSELPILDPTAFARTASCLGPDAVSRHMRTITERCESLLLGLRATDALTCGADELTDAAHTLAGSAGMFGFARLSIIGRRFERAVRTGAAEATDVADGLDAAVVAALHEIHSRKPTAVDA